MLSLLYPNVGKNGKTLFGEGKKISFGVLAHLLLSPVLPNPVIHLRRKKCWREYWKWLLHLSYHPIVSLDPAYRKHGKKSLFTKSPIADRQPIRVIAGSSTPSSSVVTRSTPLLQNSAHYTLSKESHKSIKSIKSNSDHCQLP
ncbi:unnamed protein product [Periconia digitata]|uniref:Uncharacterized protein n=1 Tax=Periconia digitata TaxID=1303443 RepID=A0A9W4UF93_9PLEO|nr:unnamed protein product [Periconia digitata]